MSHVVVIVGEKVPTCAKQVRALIRLCMAVVIVIFHCTR